MRRDVWLLVLLFAVAIVIVDPRGDFPLDDDWDFALATWQFARTGHFAFTSFTATSLYTQVLWGAMWTTLLHPSFFVLRCSTLFLAALTLFIFDAILSRFAFGRGDRFVAAAALLFHPIFFWSSFTYMTHVPFVFCSVVAIYCFVRGGPRWTAIGALAVVASFFIRQTGVVTAIPAILAARDRKSRLIAALPIVVFTLSFPVLQHGEFGYHARAIEAPFHGALYLFDHVTAAALFTLPLLLPAIRALRNRVLAVALIVLFIARALLFVGFANPEWNPFLTSTHLFGNIFINLGLGPPSLVDVHMLGYAYPLHLLFSARLVLTIAAAAAGGLLLALLIENAKMEIGYLQVICASVVLSVSQLWFDRYTIDATWPLCFVLPLIARNVRVTAVLLILVALFDVFAVRDYLQWNRDRNRAWQGLIAAGVSPLQINGGVELNALARNAFEKPRPQWTIRNDYLLTYRPLPGADVLKRYGRVYALRRRSRTRLIPATSAWR